MDRNFIDKKIEENLIKIKKSINRLINDKLILNKFKNNMLQLIAEVSCIQKFHKIPLRILLRFILI